MDWGRAKTILILSFLFLNVLLGYQMWSSRMNQATSASDTSVIKDETNKLLTSKNIRVLTDIPKNMPKLKQISVKFDDKSSNPTLVALPNPVKYNTMVGKDKLKAAIAHIGIQKAGSYEMDSFLSKNGVFVFNQMYANIPMFDVTLQLFDKKGEITGYKQAYVEVQSGEEPKEEKVISAYTAIRSLAENYLPNGVSILDVQLGYHGQRFDSETHPMLPFWRVILSDGDTYYIQAFSGAIEGNQDQTKN